MKWISIADSKPKCTCSVWVINKKGFMIKPTRATYDKHLDVFLTADSNNREMYTLEVTHYFEEPPFPTRDNK